MVTGMPRPTFDVLGFLHEPGHAASVATTVGPARLEDRDVPLIRRIYQRYVPSWSPLWTAQVESTKYRLWSTLPDRGMAVSYPDLRDRPEFRWRTAASLFGT